MRYDRGSQNQDLNGRLGTIAAASQRARAVCHCLMHGCPWISICMQQLGVFEFHYAFSLVSLIAEMICQGPMGFGTEFS